MYYRFFRLPDVLRQQTRMHRLPARRLSKVSVSLLVSLLGFSLPVSATNFDPNGLYKFVYPESESLVWGETEIRFFTPLDSLIWHKLTASNTGEGADGGQDNGRVNQDQKQILADLRWLNSINYIIFLFLLLLLFWLIFITWLFFQDSASIKRLVKRNSKNVGSARAKQAYTLRQLKSIEPKATPGANYSQASYFEPLSPLADDSVDKFATHEKLIFSLRRDLGLLRDSFLEFQDSYYSQSEASRQAPSLSPCQVEVSQSIQKQQTLEDLIASLVEEYQRAFFHNDRSALRNMSSGQLNITQNSEDSLVKSSALSTKLEVVQNGGSYLLICRDDRHWLVPEFQILTSFTTTQPAKGIFNYRRESVSAAELRWPAEVREVGGLWEVIAMGVIAVPS